MNGFWQGIVSGLHTIQRLRRPPTSARPRVALVTNMPTYHQIDLFNAIAERGEVELRVFYLRRLTHGRQWTRYGREIRHAHVFVDAIPVRGHFYLNRGLFRALGEFAPHAYVTTQYANVAQQAVMLAASLCSRPLVFWCEKAGVEFSEAPIVRAEALRDALRQLALVPVRHFPTEIWGVGQQGVDDYAARFDGPVRNFPYYADLTRFLEIERGARDTGGKSQRPVQLLFMGKLNERKGVDVLVRAIDRLLALDASGAEEPPDALDDSDVSEAPDAIDVTDAPHASRSPGPGLAQPWTLHVLGDGPLRPDLEALVERADGRVVDHGFVEIDEIPGFLAEADALVCPSRFDGFGMVVLEAMAAGLPVLSTHHTAAATELVEPGVSGWLVERGSVDALADGLLDVLAAADELHEMGVAAREASKICEATRGADVFSRRMLRLVENCEA